MNHHITREKSLAQLITLLTLFLVSVYTTAYAEVSTESKPTILIVLQEKVMGIFGTTGWEVPTQAEMTVMRKFRELGFPVVDSGTVRRNVTQAKGLRMLEADDRSAAAIGLQHNAQISIVGTAISKFAGAKLYGTQMQSIQATITARAIQNDTGHVIATATATASLVHIDELQGGVLALKEAATELAEKLASLVVASVDKEAGESRMIQLNISGLKSYRHLDFILYYFEEKVKGLSEVYLRDFTNSVAVVNLRYNNQSVVLARNVAKKKFRGFRLEPMNVTDNRIDLSVVAER